MKQEIKENEIKCHMCNTKMNYTEIESLTGEQIDIMVNQFDFPFFRSKKGKIQVLTIGFDLYLCPNCKHFRLFNRSKTKIC